METLEVAGLWWMPTRPDHRVPGILTFDLRKAGRLTLIGGLRTPPDLAENFTDTSTYGRLHGECVRRSFTLEGCFQQNLRGAPSAPDEQVIYVNNVYEDVWFSADETAEGDALHFDVDGLTEWVAQSGLAQTIRQSPADGEPWVKLEGVSLPNQEAELPGRGTVTLGHNLSTKSRDTSLSLTESFSIKLAYDSNVAIPDLLDTASDLQDLVSLATDRSAQYGFVRASHPDLMGPGGRRFFTMWSAWTAVRKEGTKPLGHDLFFTLDDIGGMNGLAEWMRVAEKYRSPLGRAMATKYADGMYVSDKLLNRAASLDGFDRIRTGTDQGPHFANRIRQCIDIAGPQFESLVHDPTKWTTELKHHRDEIAHHYGRRMRQATEEQFYISDAAYWLLMFCLLRQASVADETFDKLVSHPKLRFLANKLRAILC
jgi:hypothetical protein